MNCHVTVAEVPPRGCTQPLLSQHGPKPVCALLSGISDFTALAINVN